MCPNYQVLSAFFDGELPDSQQAKIIEHTERCPACQERLASFRYVKEYLQKASTASWPESKEKVWERLTLSMKGIKQKQEKKFFFWQKQFLLPLPLIILGGLASFFALNLLLFTFLLESTPVKDLLPAQPDPIPEQEPVVFTTSPAAFTEQLALQYDSQSGTTFSNMVQQRPTEGIATLQDIQFMPVCSRIGFKTKEFTEIYN